MIVRAAGAAGGAAFFTSWLSAAENMANHTIPPDPHDWNSYRPSFFSPEQFHILETFSAILIPTDETPGAREAHVAPFIDFVVNAAAEYAPAMQTQWRKALDQLDSKNFGRLTAGQQADLVSRMAASDDEVHDTYQLIKEMTVHAFYTSRVGLIDVLEYKGLAYLTAFPGCDHPEHYQV
jgi:hypothetical protein